MHSSNYDDLDRKQRIDELVIAIQSGNVGLLPELWRLVENLCAWYCRKLYNSMPRTFLLEYDDLYNCGYIGLWDAIQHSNPEREGAFTYFYLFYLTSAIYRENGLDTGGRKKDGRRRFDPCISPDSLRLDADVDAHGEIEGTLLDTLANVTAQDEGTDSISNSVEKIFLSQLHDALEALIRELPEDEQTLIRQKYYSKMDRLSIAEQLHISSDAAVKLEDNALIHLRQRGKAVGLEQYLESQMNYYAGTGLKRFKDTYTSATERHAIRRIELEEKYNRLVNGEE